jgi:PHD/YefM family antitoxin component YafN of YafNO toxin-antitoxin module
MGFGENSMSQTASSVEISKSFGRYSRDALRAPVTITHHGRESLVLLSHAEYQRLKRRDQEALTLSDFTDEDRAEIEAARVPDAAKNFDNELP